MGVTIANFGLAIVFLGVVVLTIGTYQLNPANAFQEQNGHIIASSELLSKLTSGLRKVVLFGIVTIGVGTLLQLTGNIIAR